MILPLAQKQQTIFCYNLLLQYIRIKSMLLLLSQISTKKTAKYLKKKYQQNPTEISLEDFKKIS